jgi:hypothetical protein
MPETKISNQRSNGGVSTWVQVMIGGMVVLLSVGSSFFTVSSSGVDKQILSINANISKLEGALLEVRSDVKAVYVTIPAQAEFKARVDKTLDRFDTEFLRIRNEMVPLSTHQQKWDSDKLVMINIQKQIDEMRIQAGSSFTLGDKLKELQHQLDDIRAHQMIVKPP